MSDSTAHRTPFDPGPFDAALLDDAVLEDTLLDDALLAELALSAAPVTDGARGGIALADAGKGSLIVIRGEVDFSLRDQASSVMTAMLSHDGPVLIDASACTFLDSSGLAFILQVMSIGSEDGRRVVLLDPPLHITDLLDVAGLRDRVPVQRTSRAQLGALDAGAPAHEVPGPGALPDQEPDGLAGGLPADVVEELTAPEPDLAAPRR